MELSEISCARFMLGLFSGAALWGGAAVAAGDGNAAAYDRARADQAQSATLADVVPADTEARQTWARHLAYDAAIYGQVLALHYQQLRAQALDSAGPNYTGFNVFAHDRQLAAPGYKPFKSPNADTLYSNAWLDLSGGPVQLDVPDTDGRYYTVNFLDAYGNATNISARTHGTKGGRYWIAAAHWQGDVPADVTLFRVTTPYVWILMRILTTDAADARRVNRLQDRFRLTPTVPAARRMPFPAAGLDDDLTYFSSVDYMLRAVGYPAEEAVLVRRFRALGIGDGTVRARAEADPALRAALSEGRRDALQVIERSIGQGGRPVGGWSAAVDVGRYGENYLYRAAINTLGTGANVVDENYPFTTFVDADGARLDGATGHYRLTLAPPPPARFFWSVTAYDARTRELIPNPAGRYIINDRTPGLVRGKDGSVTILMRRDKPKGREAANWLPTPDGPFYIAIRAQGPSPDIAAGRWAPPAIERIKW